MFGTKFPPLTRPRKLSTIALITLNWLFSAAYRFPEQLGTKRPPRPGEIRVSIINYIELLGPVWSTSFSMVAAVMTYSLITRRFLILSNVMGGMIWASYGVALWFGVFASKPIGSVLLPACALVFSVIHLSFIDAYSEFLARKEMKE